jgi:hypothetical protein
MSKNRRASAHKAHITIVWWDCNIKSEYFWLLRAPGVPHFTKKTAEQGGQQE